MTVVLGARDAERADRRPASDLRNSRRLKPQCAQERHRVEHDLKLVPDAATDTGIVLVAVGTVSLIPHPPQPSVSDGVVAISLPAVMLDPATVTVTPDPYGLLNLVRHRAARTETEQLARPALPLALLRIGDERSV
jgi:hypothetical protein